MWAAVLRPSAETKRFIPACTLAYVAVVLSLGLQFDLLSIGTAIVLIPLTASALNLVFAPLARALITPERVLSKVADEVLKTLAKNAKLSRRRREKTKQAIVERARPRVSEEFNEFWTRRAREEREGKEGPKQEVALISLAFLGICYYASGLLAWSRASSAMGSGASSQAVQPQVWAGLLLLFVGTVFWIAFDRERRTYVRLLWDQIPVLMATGETLGSEYWKLRQEFIQNRRATLGDETTEQLLFEARMRERLALRGELERDWIAHVVGKEAGEDPKIMAALLSAALRTQRAKATRSSWRVAYVQLLAVTVGIIGASVQFLSWENSGILIGVIAASAVLLLGILYIYYSLKSRALEPTEDIVVTDSIGREGETKRADPSGVTRSHAESDEGVFGPSDKKDP